MLIFLGILFGGIFVYKFYGSYMMRKSMSEQAMPPVAVSAMAVTYEAWQPKITGTATVRAINGVDLTSEVTGLVKTIHYEAGKDVKIGEVLVELNADAEIARLHSLEADKEIAEINYKRDKAQFAIQGVSRATLDADEFTLKSKTAQVLEQTALIAKKTIRAPFAGRLGVININLGQFINPGDSIATLQALDRLYVDFILPQQDVPQIKTNQEITFTTDTYPGEKFTGKITAINPKVEVATRTVLVEATIINLEHKILPGMYGVVDITTSAAQNYLTVPQTAISYNPYGDYVYILKDEKKDKQGKSTFVAFQKFVTTSKTRGDQVQILKGIEKGDRVVTAGQLKLKNGAHVYINNTVPLSNDPNPLIQERGQ